MKMIFDEIRKRKGITKMFIAKELGVSRGTIDNWIEGKSIIRLDQAIKLTKILNCKLEDLYEEE
ncbi:helix-turn-helix transcriptional regulator [Oceanobacillus sp. ISL-73]|uniref:helix-turn-helix transcriptional regulator n=2 Tax=unclassified Oceanobacillus TaxID=2630292 RepID=UPI001BE7D877|nr:helix-turn-helix transcriptional regulator [Oceanobacillus sp. ISL-73]MBT2599072.1 helix-turn-helix transcriptional regulator [Oceanobacillus sp. ISL-74]MBT2651990.1 helix-turn-helix transcriptional regulator [Oceanobacillus sp. ISL-73]